MIYRSFGADPHPTSHTCGNTRLHEWGFKQYRQRPPHSGALRADPPPPGELFGGAHEPVPSTSSSFSSPSSPSSPHFTLTTTPSNAPSTLSHHLHSSSPPQLSNTLMSKTSRFASVSSLAPPPQLLPLMDSIVASSSSSSSKSSSSSQKVKRDVRAVDKFIELAIVLDESMVSLQCSQLLLLLFCPVCLKSCFQTN